MRDHPGSGSLREWAEARLQEPMWHKRQVEMPQLGLTEQNLEALVKKGREMAEGYPSFPKIPRWNREIVITEKIDGTNGLVCVVAPGEDGKYDTRGMTRYQTTPDGLLVGAGSRNRWLNPESDNFGFAQWVWDHADELAKLGPGKHYGEWYGKGIQRSYGLPDKRFMLFNTAKWGPADSGRPNCCEVATVLYECLAADLSECLVKAITTLEAHGSAHVPGFLRPEGVVIYHTAGNNLYKVTLEGDGAKTKDGYVVKPAPGGKRYVVPPEDTERAVISALNEFENKYERPREPELVAA